MTRSGFQSCIGLLLLAGVLCVGLAALAAPASAGSADDDLQAVKKAVLASNAAQARPPAEEEPGAASETKSHPRKGEPSWLRVRVVEKAGRRARVSVNLPLGLVRSFGDDWPIAWHDGCHRRERCGTTLGAILRALDSGQQLVEIEDDEKAVRVWVE